MHEFKYGYKCSYWVCVHKKERESTGYDCTDCTYFEKRLAVKLKESQDTYCILYEKKPMSDCKGATFNSYEGHYECECMKPIYGDLRKYGLCEYKTICDEFIEQ